jgi:oxygen-dependent protoporphyrinogen oxidase
VPSPIQVAVVGGGISGLSCAYRLHKLGHSVLLFEPRQTPGGVIGTIEHDGFRFETGPQSFLGTPMLVDLIRELNIDSELLQANPRAPRYVFARGKMHAIPMSPQAILTTSLLSVSSRYRLATEAFRKSRPADSEESVADFVRRKFGHEILEYLVAPFISGVYAGDPEMLSLKAAFPSLDEWERQYGSVIRGAMSSRKKQSGPRPGLYSFRNGLATLLNSLSRTLGDGLVSGAHVDSIEKNTANDGAGFTLRFSCGAQHEVATVPAVVVAAPAYIASHLLSALSPRAAQLLSGVSYAPVGVVATAYKRLQVANSLIGFGVLIPRKEGLRTLGTIWNSSLFPGCAPADSVLLTSFVGGATDTGIFDDDDEYIMSVVESETGKLLEISGAPVERRLWRHPKALPQYNLGHGHVVEGVREEIQKTPGIFLAGNYLEGPSIGQCVERANAAAAAASAYLQGGAKSN